MNRKHVFVISLVLGAAAVAGASAALETVALGPTQAKRQIPDAVIAARAKKLERFATALRQARNTPTPPLPRVPQFAPVTIPVAPPAPAPVAAADTQVSAAAAPAQPEPPVKYVQAPPVVQYEQPAATQTPAGHEQGDDHEGDSGDYGDD
jgi:hypothetical protein